MAIPQILEDLQGAAPSSNTVILFLNFSEENMLKFYDNAYKYNVQV